jgi:hypothetical protein
VRKATLVALNDEMPAGAPNATVRYMLHRFLLAAAGSRPSSFERTDRPFAAEPLPRELADRRGLLEFDLRRVLPEAHDALVAEGALPADDVAGSGALDLGWVDGAHRTVEAFHSARRGEAAPAPPDSPPQPPLPPLPRKLTFEGENGLKIGLQGHPRGKGHPQSDL